MTQDRRSAPGSYYAERKHPISRENWHKLPLYLRQRWWRETRFDRIAPSDELVMIIMAVLGKEENRQC